MAGASAAYHLSQNGLDVMVIEARNRKGGRIHTDNSFGFPLELGANWVHYHKNNPLLQWIKKLNISTEATPYTNIYFIKDTGKHIHDIDILPSYHQYNRAIAKAQKKFNLEDISVQEALKQTIDTSGSGKQRKLYLETITRLWESDNGADFNEVSINGMDDGSEDDFGGNDWLVTGGYINIINYFLNGIDVQLNSNVTEIVQDKNGVTVTTNKAIFESDFAVITVPITVLQKNTIRFSPALPPEKIQSIQKIKLGLMDKVALEFTEKCWNTDRRLIGTVSSSEKNFDLIVNFAKENKPVLLALSSRNFAKEMENDGPEKIKNYFTDFLFKSFKKPNIEIKNMMVTNWFNDEFSQGSYSFFPVGATINDFDIIAAPHGKVFFAGEATSKRYYSYVHGAYLSGVREAERISKL